MTAKEYLSQAHRIDRLIDVKLEEAARLRALATKATATLSDTPPTGTRNVNSMEDIITKLVDLEAEIKLDIDKLLILKKDIATAIKGVDNADYRVLLELRYLANKSWRDISLALCCGGNYVFEIHRAALSAIKIPAS